ncbi:hypothetical protein IFR05_001567 [Cadophora sp. M221]|nr:hypothetical protein IFR05_001567 [Cadophora sp. M221]
MPKPWRPSPRLLNFKDQACNAVQKDPQSLIDTAANIASNIKAKSLMVVLIAASPYSVARQTGDLNLMKPMLKAPTPSANSSSGPLRESPIKRYSYIQSFLGVQLCGNTAHMMPSIWQVYPVPLPAGHPPSWQLKNLSFKLPN